MLHGVKKLSEAVVMIDRISCKHVIVMMGGTGKRLLQFVAPLQCCNPRLVSPVPPGIPVQVTPQITKGFWQIRGCQFSTYESEKSFSFGLKLSLNQGCPILLLEGYYPAEVSSNPIYRSVRITRNSRQVCWGWLEPVLGKLL